jgi:radical SAM superfamily enzyme YgiQ (UPF0313 family)
MKIILIRPFITGEAYEPPLGIGFIASYLREYGKSDIEILDMEVLKWNREKIKTELAKRKPEIVGISAFSYNRFRGFEIAKIAKDLGIFNVFGGPHTTFVDKETLEGFPFIDVIVRGEGEATMLELVEKVASDQPLDDVKGITFQKKGRIIRNPDREFIADINTIPQPAWDLFPMEKYKYYAVLGTRGCPYNCNFCASPRLWKRKLRIRRPEKVVDEIEYLLAYYGEKVVHIKDDTFTAKKDWLYEFCSEIEKRNLKFKWECLGRVNTVDEELLRRIHETGCELIEYGVETGNEKIMRSINKQITKDQVRTVVKLAKKTGLRVGTFFMLGHPEETEENLNETFDFALEIRPDMCSFNPADAFPGSLIFDIAKNSGYLPQAFSWNDNRLNLSGHPVPRFENPGLPEHKLVEYSKRFYIRFAFARLFDVKDIGDLGYLFKNKYTPIHLTPKSKDDIMFLFEEFKEGIKRSPSITQKLRGFAILPFFTFRIGVDIWVRQLKKIGRWISRNIQILTSPLG